MSGAMGHTPGPWTIRTERLLATEDAPAREGSFIRYIVEAVDPADSRYSVRLYTSARESAEANARLIAAAPELLAACRQVQADIGDRLTGKTVLMLRAAIAKAEGGQP